MLLRPYFDFSIVLTPCGPKSSRFDGRDGLARRPDVAWLTHEGMPGATDSTRGPKGATSQSRTAFRHRSGLVSWQEGVSSGS